LLLLVALPGIRRLGRNHAYGLASARPVFGVGRRGRGGAVDRRSLASAEANIQRYLEECGDENPGEFYIQGWRWHTMSLAREASRLQRLAQKIQIRSATPTETEALRKAADYVVDFNMRGLHKIERDIFFPWVRKKVGSESSLNGSGVPSAFETLMDCLDSDRRNIEGLGKSLVSSSAPFFCSKEAVTAWH